MSKNIVIKDRKKKSAIREWIEAIVIAVILALFVRSFVVQAFKIPSGSMEPTLLIGDHILVNKFIYGVRLPIVNKVIIPVKHPHRGDVIVFIYPEDHTKDFIKRVIGLPGETIEIRDNKVYINGKRYPDPHGYFSKKPAMSIYYNSLANFGPVTVPKDSYFVMGDNRDHSLDSRAWGFVPFSLVKGKAFLIYWSWDSSRFRPRWNRIGDLIE